MTMMKPPTVPEQPVPVLPTDALQRLLKACAGKDFEARRDTAIVMVLIDAEPRLAEVAGARLQDVDFEYGVLRVIGKGGRERSLPFGDNTARALDRYLRKRAQPPHAAWNGCGSGSSAASPGLASARSSAAAAARPISTASTHTCSGTPSPIPGEPRATARPT
jgi:site-specific recombinase XerC